MRKLLQPVWDYLLELWRFFAQGWGRFWFTPTDPTTVAFIRICTGLVLTYIYATCLGEVENFVGGSAWVDAIAINQIRDVNELERYSPDGKFTEMQRRLHDSYYPSVYLLTSNPVAVRIIYDFSLLAMICLALGLFSRTASILSWIGHLSFIQRGYLLWFGMDSVLAMLTFYLMFAPSGAVWSVDNLIRRARHARQILGAKGAQLRSESPLSSWTANLVMRLIQVHMCVIYFCAGCAKLQGRTWWNGSAVWFTIMIPEFRLVDMSWLAKIEQLPWLPEFVSSLGVAATIFFEVGFPFLIYVRILRPFMLFMGVAMHAGIGLFMGLGGFGASMLTGLASFLKPSSLQWVAATLFKGPSGYRFIYDRNDPPQLDLASWIHAVDPWQQVELIDASVSSNAAAAGSLLAPDGTVLTGFAAFGRLTRVLRTLWLFWPVLAWKFAALRSGGKLTPAEAKP
jgi:hypothetical protein